MFVPYHRERNQHFSNIKFIVCKCFQFGKDPNLSFGKRLTLSRTSPGFYVSAVQVLKTLWEKEKLLVTSNFSFSHSLFYPSKDLSVIFVKFEIVVCKLFQFEKSLKFAIWERVKQSIS